MKSHGKTWKNTDKPVGCSPGAGNGGGAAAGPSVGPPGASPPSEPRTKLGAEGNFELKTNNKPPISSGEGL